MPSSQTVRRITATCSLTLCLVGLPLPATAQLPATRIDSVFPLSANPGKTVEVTIAGADLDGVASLQFSHAGITAKQKMAEPGPFDEGPQPVANQFVVTVAGNVPLGRYEVRATGKYGVSNPRTFFVTGLGCLAEEEPNQSAEEATQVELPADVSGMLSSAADTDYYTFTAKANQRIVLDCAARRADSQADAVVAVYDSAGRELSNSRDGYRGDPLLDFNVQSGQTYTIKVYDAGFRGGSAYAYRFTVGALPHVDFLYPPAGPAGKRSFTVFGRNLQGGQNAGFVIDGKPIQKITASLSIPANSSNLNNAFVASASGGLNAVAYRAKNNLGWSNAVLVGVATATPVTEKEPNNSPAQAQKLTVPCEVMGKCDLQRDTDWFSFEAKKGESLTVEVISNRLGLDTDPMILVQQIIKPAEGEQPEQTKQLAYVTESTVPGSGPEFDTYSADPIHHFTAPADGIYRIMVRDRKNALRADPRQIYCLAIRKPQPDFQLVAIPNGSYSSVLLRKGGQIGIRVVAFRKHGFDGEIKLSATGMTSGVKSSEAIIGPETKAATLVLAAAANAASSIGRIQVVGTAKAGNANVRRVARFASATHPLPPRPNANQPQLPTDARLTDSIVLSIGEEAAPVSIQAGEGKVWETSRGGILKIPYTRAGAFKGKLTLRPDVLPTNVEAKVLTINPNNNSGQYEIKLKNNTPTGTYSFVLSGVAEQHNYSRNPEAAAAAKEKKQKVDKIAAEAAAAAKAATDAQAAANKAATDAAAVVKDARTKKTQAEQALAQANQALDSATNQYNQAKAAAAANPKDTNLGTAAANAQKALTDASAKVKTATDAVSAAQKVLDEAMAKLKTATDAKGEADKKAAEATERSKLAAELKAKTDKLVTDTANAAKPKKVNFPVVSTPVTLKITAAPITLTIANPAVPLKQGAKVEVPVTIKRLYGFTPAVNLSAVLPSGVGGISIPNSQIPANQTQGKLTFTAAANATAGSHAVTIHATMNFNGQNLTVDQPVTLNLQEVPKTK